MRFRPFLSLIVKTWCCLSIAAAPLWGIGCESQSIDPTGGETHFLKLCDASPNSCGSTLECLCGVCTRPCSSDHSCSSLPQASCSEAFDACYEPKDDKPAPSGACEVFCDEDQDCAVLSAEFSCKDGVCREGNGSDSGELPDGMGGADSSCIQGTPANEVLIVGDSFFATTHQVTAYLEDAARTAGALAPGYRYRDASRLGNNALALVDEGILDQFESAALDSQVRFVVTNGGGADVLLGGCENLNADCPLIHNATQAFSTLLTDMLDHGVEAVIYVAYPDPQLDAVRARLDVLRPELEQVCATSALPCHFLDLRPLFAGHYDEYIEADGLNPTAVGSQKTAQAIWEVMEERCIAQ